MNDPTFKSFGQFLHERGLLDGSQLLEVLERRRAEHATLPDLSMKRGLLDEAQVLAVRNEQLRADVDFGPAAISLGLLTEEQLSELESKLDEGPSLMTRLLVEGGFIAPEDLASMELAYFEQSMVQTVQLRLRLECTRSSQLAEASASVVQRLYSRVMGSPLAVHFSGASLPGAPDCRVWWQMVRLGGESFTLALHMAEEDAMGIAQIVLGMPLERFDDLAEDAVSEFLNIVMGHVCGHVRGGVRADPPQVARAEDFRIGDAEAVVLQCEGDEIVFHFALA